VDNPLLTCPRLNLKEMAFWVVRSSPPGMQLLKETLWVL
jgi:hypothetical protein